MKINRINSYIQNYKNIIKDIEERRVAKNNRKNKNSNSFHRGSSIAQSVYSGGKADSTVGVNTTNTALELGRVEKLTNTLNIFEKIDNLLEFFII